MQTNDGRTTRTTLAGVVLAFAPLFALAGNPQDCASERMPTAQHGMMLPPGAMPGGGPEGMPPMGMPPLSPLDRLDLSESQQEQVDEIMHAQMKLIIEKQRQIRKTVLALQEIPDSDSESFDAVRTKSQANAHGKAVGELAYLHAETQARVAAVLTPAQRKQLRGLMQTPGCPRGKP